MMVTLMIEECDLTEGYNEEAVGYDGSTSERFMSRFRSRGCGQNTWSTEISQCDGQTAVHLRVQVHEAIAADLSKGRCLLTKLNGFEASSTLTMTVDDGIRLTNDRAGVSPSVRTSKWWFASQILLNFRSGVD